MKDLNSDIYENIGATTRQVLDRMWSYDASDTIERNNFLQTSANFKSFAEGLINFAKKAGFSGNIDATDEVIEFVSQKMKDADIIFDKQNLNNWLKGKVNPQCKVQSRENMFKLCFALMLDERETEEFFNQVYFDRGFNFRNLREVVYYYCFKYKQSYVKAQELLEQLEQLTVTEDDTKDVATQVLLQDIDTITDERKLLEYIAQHVGEFKKINLTAKKNIEQLLKKAFGLARIELQKAKTMIEEDIAKGKWYVNQEENSKEIINVDLILNAIYGFDLRKMGKGNSIRQKSKLPDVVKMNFPQAIQISNILNNYNEEASFDAIRKTLILLCFYTFFMTASLEEDGEVDLFDAFIAETNDRLFHSGFGQLYPRNPYDYIFIHCATSEMPLEEFRSILDELYLDMIYE